MSKFTSFVASLALVATLVALPTSAMARGNGGPASSHRGCVSNNGIPLDDGQSVIVDGETISCNNGTVCHFKAGNFPYCYVNVQAAQAVSVTPTGNPTTPKHLSGAQLSAALKKARATTSGSARIVAASGVKARAH
jgi:hypothetical protein